MRYTIILLAVASLSACDRKIEPTAAPDTVAVPAALSFDGAESSDPTERIAHGERLSHILGCTGCHKPNLEGQWFNDDAPEMGKLYASNLTRVLPTMSDAQLETLLREGTHPTRGDLWIMPSEVFQRLSEADMAALIAHLRTVKPSGAPTPAPAMSAMAKAAVASGKFKPVSASVAEYRTTTPPDLGEGHAFGRYIAATTCAECHGGDLTGVPDFLPGVNTPDLDIAGAYSDAELVTLLTTGKGKTRADLGLMTLVGKGHFSHLTGRERSALIAYLKARADRPQPARAN
ncbi:MAG: cytochrome c [Sphingomonas bacterium]|nr:cytochrome c [Sphingomonas bacterium]